jgi:predicted phosphodiesterase
MFINLIGPTLVFGGPYSNLESLKAVRQVAHDLNIPANHCICTGDIVAYCADAKACVAEIQDWGLHTIMGNCEESLANGSNDCGCGFVEGTACDVLSKQWFTYASAELNDKDRQWLSNLARKLKFQLNDYKIEAMHGAIDQINQFIFASQDDIIESELQKTDADIVLAGHSGLAFIKKENNRVWMNAGAIGIPANDGQTATWYSLLHPKDQGIYISFHRLHYNHELAANKMRTAGLAESYAKALETGLWPSLDVLPQTEKKQTGKPLQVDPFFFDKHI